MKKTLLKAMLILGACIMALSCGKIGGTNPLEGSTWKTSMKNYLTDEVVDYYLVFSGYTVQWWSTENPDIVSGSYTVLGSTVSFKDFNVKFRSDETFLRTVESGSFTDVSLNLIFKKNQGTTLNF